MEDQGQLSGGHKDDPATSRGVRDESAARVALVGAGPGAPDLITVRGRELLARANTVLYDRLISHELLGLCRPDAKLINVGKHAGVHSVPQQEINRLLMEEALCVGAGGLVVRLKGGDPYVFGRGGEEASALAAADIPFEVVPGVSSAVAAPAWAGIPVTDRRFASSCTVVTGHRRADGTLGIDYDALVRTRGTLVFLMGVATMPQICAGLLAAGAAAGLPAAVVERGTSASQRRIDGTLGGIAERARVVGVESPAVLVVGAVCALAPELDWYDRLPLRGIRVLVTRPADRAAGLVRALAGEGAAVEEFPCIETRPLPSAAKMLGRLRNFTWLVLTSTFGVRCLMDVIAAGPLDLRCLGHLRIAAIGSATAAALAAHRITADYVPEVYDGAHLGAGLVERTDAACDRVLIFRARDSLTDLPEALERAGVPFEDVAAYETVLAPVSPAPDLARRLAAGEFDAVTFTSASTARGFARAFPDVAPRAFTAVCLGETTRRAAAALGYRCVVSRAATIESLVERTVEAIGRERGARGGA